MVAFRRRRLFAHWVLLLAPSPWLRSFSGLVWMLPVSTSLMEPMSITRRLWTTSALLCRIPRSSAPSCSIPRSLFFFIYLFYFAQNCFCEWGLIWGFKFLIGFVEIEFGFSFQNIWLLFLSVIYGCLVLLMTGIFLLLFFIYGCGIISSFINLGCASFLESFFLYCWSWTVWLIYVSLNLLISCQPKCF